MQSSSSAVDDPSVRYAIAIFLGSSLLFLIEPIAGKRILPLLGGSAAVWTACLVFFQTALLLGYLAAHWLATRATRRTQASAYLALLVLSAVQLTFAAQSNLRANPNYPIASVLWLLTLLIGLPFVTLSATSPLLQSWYARITMPASGSTGAPARRPYRLFAISNAGSLLALLIYPWLVEPRVSLHGQVIALAGGLAILAAACAAIIVSTSATVTMPASSSQLNAAVEPAPIGDTPSGSADGARESVARRVLWVLLAACGSMLLSAVTVYLSQNVATIPLLWILPLIAYLLSFVVAFSDVWHPRPVVLALAAIGLGVAGYLFRRGELTVSVPVAVGAFCAALFALCLFCHSELYARRPSPARLTSFYFYVAAGGALGAIAVGIGAPTLLSDSYELAIALCVTALLALLVTWSAGLNARAFWLGAAVLLCAVLVQRVRSGSKDVLLKVRNFYGVLHVTQSYVREDRAPVRALYNGVIEHGEQVFRADMRRAPTSYYGHPSGVGLALDLCCGQRPRRIGVIGLGTGTIAAYGKPGDVIRFYDINPAVESIARNTFTYLRDSPAKIDVVTGDARVSLSEEVPQRFDVLVVDAFSGDAIPVHLITSEALDLYRRHLQPNGIVAFHVSNRYLDLPPVVQQLADHAGMRASFISTDDDLAHDLYGADWVLVTRDSAFLAQPQVAKATQAISVSAGLRRWTDDYNSVLPILRMRKK